MSNGEGRLGRLDLDAIGKEAENSTKPEKQRESRKETSEEENNFVVFPHPYLPHHFSETRLSSTDDINIFVLLVTCRI